MPSSTSSNNHIQRPPCGREPGRLATRPLWENLTPSFKHLASGGYHGERVWVKRTSSAWATCVCSRRIDVVRLCENCALKLQYRVTVTFGKFT